MKKLISGRIYLAILLLLSFAACKKLAEDKQADLQHPEAVTVQMMLENGNNPDEQSIRDFEASGQSADNARNNQQHFLYTESNTTGSNEIIAYKMLNNGSLNKKWVTNSGGAGTGSPLGSQGAIALSDDNEWLFAVNAASNSVSSFKINANGRAELAHTISSMGNTPVSLTIHDNLLYVLNRGSDNVHGIRLGNNGSMTHINNSTMPLSGSGVDAPQVSFTPNGNWLLVTEKATNKISSFKVNNNGSLQAGIFTNSTGATPFGFEFARNEYMIVSNAVGGAAGAGSATSYINQNHGVPLAVNGAVPNLQAAPCWVATAAYGRFAYITNTASNNISSYYVAPDGAIYLVQSEAATSGMGPLDIVVASNNYHVYTLNMGSNSITGFKRKPLGGLEHIETANGLPAGATGLAAF